MGVCQRHPHKSIARIHSNTPYKKDANGEKQEQAESTYVTTNTKIKHK